MRDPSPNRKRRILLLCLAALLLVSTLSAVLLDTVRTLAETVGQTVTEADRGARETVPSSEEYWKQFNAAESIPYELEPSKTVPESTPAAEREASAAPEGQTEASSGTESSDPQTDTKAFSTDGTLNSGEETTDTESEPGTEPEPSTEESAETEQSTETPTETEPEGTVSGENAG